MPLLERPRFQSSPAQAAEVIKSTLHGSLLHMEQALTTVRAMVEVHGRREIAGALGAEAAELQQVYRKIQAAINQLDGSREVPDLPE